MVATRAERRPVTAREMAERFGKSPQAIRNFWAEPREVFEARANERREKIIELYRGGMKQKDIAAALGITPALVSKRVKEWRQEQAEVTEPVLIAA